MENNTGVNNEGGSTINDAADSLSSMQGDQGGSVENSSQQSAAPSTLTVEIGGKQYNVGADHFVKLANALSEYEQKIADYESRLSQTAKPQQQNVDPNEPLVPFGNQKVPMSQIANHFNDAYGKLNQQYEQLRQERTREKAEAILNDFQQQRGISDEDMNVVVKTMVENGIPNPRIAYLYAFGDNLADMEVNKVKAMMSNITPTGRGFTQKTDQQMTVEGILEAASRMSF